MESTHTSGRTVRAVLDYIHWICREMRQIGFHAGTDRDEWCRRVQRAYTVLFIPIFPGHGDPYPPDVPPARNPGIWPDIPAASFPGMTLRHQLTVMEMLTRDLRDRPWAHARTSDTAEWDRRLGLAFTALDHGEHTPMPEAARSEPSEQAIEAAKAEHKALKDRARRRSRQLRRQMRKRKAARKKQTAKKKAAPKKTAKKSATKKTTAKKKAAATKKKKTGKKKKTAKRKKAAQKKTAKKKTAKRKKTTKKKAK
jgi:hypothetical protein